MQTAAHEEELECKQGVGYPLTCAECGALQALLETGYNQAAARRMGVSTATFRNHLEHIHQKLGVHSSDEAIGIAVTEGWIPGRHWHAG